MDGLKAQATPVENLWTVKDLAGFLHRSDRWVWTALKRRDAEPGSIPCYRLPGGAPRFDPFEVREWVKAGCPPVSTFKAWQEDARRH